VAGFRVGVDAHGWSQPGYGAPTAGCGGCRHPLRRSALSRQFTDADVRFDGGVWRRATTAGTVVVSASAHRGTLEPRRKDASSWNAPIR
jgi:hypothetical protein